MKKFAKMLALILAVSMLFALAACGGQQPEAAPESAAPSENAGEETAAYNIGIVQLVEHNALDQATKGFQDALTEKLGDKVTFDVQNAQGEATNCTTIATKFVNDGVDLILANATGAAQAAAQATGEIPIVGVSITDYVVAGLADSNEAPGRNVTGASDLSPINEHVKLIQAFCPDATKVGIVYCSSEDNSVVQGEQAKAALEAAGFTVAIYTAADSNEIQTVLTKACGEQDALYIPTDNLFASSMETVKNITVPAKIPVFCGEESMALAGGLATYSVNYYTLGQQAGEMAYEILANGADPASMAIQFMDAAKLSLVINEEVAEAIGIEIPSELAAQMAE